MGFIKYCVCNLAYIKDHNLKTKIYRDIPRHNRIYQDRCRLYCNRSFHTTNDDDEIQFNIIQLFLNKQSNLLYNLTSGPRSTNNIRRGKFYSNYYEDVLPRNALSVRSSFCHIHGLLQNSLTCQLFTHSVNPNILVLLHQTSHTLYRFALSLMTSSDL